MTIKPMLCRLEPKVLNSPDYIWEPKLDGIRAVVVVNGVDHKIQARSGTDKTGLFPELKIETRLPAILDGEIISGSSFQNIQHRANRQNGIGQAVKEFPANYVVFDVIELDGKDMRSLPLEHRKEVLSRLVLPTENCALVCPVTDGVTLFESIRAAGGEGVVGKLKTGRYLENKREWLKVKCWQLGEFLVVGYTAGTGWRANLFGALVLSDLNGNYVGEVGTGFNENEIATIMRRFVPAPCPWSRPPEAATWVKPFPVKVQYQEKTNDGRLRFPSYKGGA